MLRLFISSVQKEFALERAALRSNVDGGGSVAAQPESRPESQPESFDVRVPVMTLRRWPETAFAAVGGQVAGQVGPWGWRVLSSCVQGPLRSSEIEKGAGRRRETLQRNYLDQLLRDGWMEMTIPDKPYGRLQKYRPTAKARMALAALQPKGNA